MCGIHRRTEQHGDQGVAILQVHIAIGVDITQRAFRNLALIGNVVTVAVRSTQQKDIRRARIVGRRIVAGHSSDGSAIAEQRSLTSVDGIVSACVWDYAGGMEFLRRFWDASIDEDPGTREFDEGRRFPVCSPEALVNLFCKAGMGDVTCEPLETPTVFRNFDDYWQPFLGGTGPAPSYVASLDADRRRALAAKLEQTLPRRPDGVIALTGLAWAVRGTVR